MQPSIVRAVQSLVEALSLCDGARSKACEAHLELDDLGSEPLSAKAKAIHTRLCEMSAEIRRLLEQAILEAGRDGP